MSQNFNIPGHLAYSSTFTDGLIPNISWVSCRLNFCDVSETQKQLHNSTLMKIPTGYEQKQFFRHL